jgi:hypothetical protein
VKEGPRRCCGGGFGFPPAEADFLVQAGGRVLPIEVKAGESLRARSFKFFCQKYRPETAVRTSLSDYREESWMINLPLYAIGMVGALGRPRPNESQAGAL